MLAALQWQGEKSAFITCMYGHKQMETHSHITSYEFFRNELKRKCKLCGCVHTDTANICIAVGGQFPFACMVTESNLGL